MIQGYWQLHFWDSHWSCFSLRILIASIETIKRESQISDELEKERSLTKLLQKLWCSTELLSTSYCNLNCFNVSMFIDPSKMSAAFVRNRKDLVNLSKVLWLQLQQRNTMWVDLLLRFVVLDIHTSTLVSLLF